MTLQVFTLHNWTQNLYTSSNLLQSHADPNVELLVLVRKSQILLRKSRPRNSANIEKLSYVHHPHSLVISLVEF